MLHTTLVVNSVVNKQKPKDKAASFLYSVGHQGENTKVGHRKRAEVKGYDNGLTFVFVPDPGLVVGRNIGHEKC